MAAGSTVALESTPDQPRQGQAQVSVDELLAGFDGKIRRVRIGLFYRLALLLVTVVMVALPLVYLTIIGAVGYAVVWHAVHNLHLFQQVKDLRGALVLYLAPLFGGLLVIFFLVKPLLARRAGDVPPRTLKPLDEPLLYAFCERLCETVRAPRPTRIAVDCEVNASASLGNGLWGIFFRRLTLTIGLPLAASLDLRQFTGVLAHELGHFSQGGAMRLSTIIRQINFWFARVVYERDHWDEQLVRWSKSDIRIALFVYIIRLFIWLTRRVLWVLMHIGHGVSCLLLRQMEYDADRYEARVAGSATFERTALDLPALALAAHKARNDLQHAWEERRLGDDLPALIRHNLVTMPDDVRREVAQAELKQKARLFDTHPSTRNRIRKAAREAAEGIFRDERPASALFGDFTGLCKMATLDFYAGVLGPEVAGSLFVPTTDLLTEDMEQREQAKSIDRFCHGTLRPGRPLRLEPQQLIPPANPRETAHELTKAREQFALMASEIPAALARLEEARRLEMRAFIAGDLLGAKVRFKAADLGLAKARPNEVESMQAKADQLRNEGELNLLPFEDAIRRRLLAALQLLHTPQLLERVPEGERLLAQARPLASALQAYDFIAKPMGDLVHGHALLGYLLHQLHGRERDEKLVTRIKHTAKGVRRLMDLIHSSLQATAYPFAHGDGEVSIGHYVLESVPPAEEIGEIMSQSKIMLERLARLYYRVTGQLIQTAELVEQAMGLEPIDKPTQPSA